MSENPTTKRYCDGPGCTGDDQCPWEDVCMCGSPCAGHGLSDGHSPVSMHSYCSRPDNVNLLECDDVES